MKKIFLILSILLLVCTSAYFVKAEVAKHSKFVTYEEVLQRKKPAIVYFYSERCSYCIAFTPIFKQMSEEFNKKFLFSTINIYDPQYSKLIRKFKIRSVPAVFIYNKEDNKFQQISPYYFSEPSLRNILASY